MQVPSEHNMDKCAEKRAACMRTPRRAMPVPAPMVVAEVDAWERPGLYVMHGPQHKRGGELGLAFLFVSVTARVAAGGDDAGMGDADSEETGNIGVVCVISCSCGRAIGGDLFKPFFFDLFAFLPSAHGGQGSKTVRGSTEERPECGGLFRGSRRLRLGLCNRVRENTARVQEALPRHLPTKRLSLCPKALSEHRRQSMRGGVRSGEDPCWNCHAVRIGSRGGLTFVLHSTSSCTWLLLYFSRRWGITSSSQ
ncbi:hypothetical protein BCR34DRAFT_335867 [Clohesyomyces aquaticus]|uniref:Uncharacterized protein n=1 Tax=Clohesyomyces aquaticus TaxID=1231657 RepID=A0A1Y1XUD8_9PLEO|nr:hypothetical protein BCR34DRAFT_335867 [Clohesyomyces aquaticus]